LFSYTCPFYSRDNVNLYPFDLIFGASKTILYANLQEKEASKYVLSLLTNGMEFVLRPTGKTDHFGVDLRGFGIEMRPFKYSMEYGVKDSIVQDDKSNASRSFYDPTTDGFDEIPADFNDPRAFYRFGVQFTSYLEEKNTSEMTKLLRDISQNYPVFYSDILQTEPTDTASAAFEEIKMLVDENSGFSVLNGRSIPISNLDVFTLMDIYNEESILRSVLMNEFNLSQESMNKFFNTPLSDSSAYLFDFRSPYISFINDLENDKEYSSWPDSVDAIYQSQSRFFKVKKNLVSVVLYTDPTSRSGISELFMLSSLLSHGIPVRVGISPSFNMGDPLSRRIGFAYHHIKIRSSKEAFKFLLISAINCGYNESTRRVNQPNEIHFAKAYSHVTKGLSCLDWNELINLYPSHTVEHESLRDTQLYFLEKGILPGQFCVNGQLVSSEQGIQNLVMQIQSMSMTIQRLMYQNQITDLDSFDVITSLSQISLMVDSLDQQILSDTPIGLGIKNLPMSLQLEYLAFLDNINWTYEDDTKSYGFYILFTNGNPINEIFNEFMKYPHSISSKFVVDPPINPELYSCFGFEQSGPVLIANGRVFNDFCPINTKQLELIDLWSNEYLIGNLIPYVEKISNNPFTLMAFLSSIITDWRHIGVERIHFPSEVWGMSSPLIYVTNHSKKPISWDLIVNPFTREFQRISGLVHFIENNSLVNIRMILVPPTEFKEPLNTYYRMALDNDKALFTMLNDTTTYSSMPDVPQTWITESMRASVDLDNILLSELGASIHCGQYVLTNIIADGDCKTLKGEIPEKADIALFNLKGEKLSDTVVMKSNSYWQLPSNPGEWIIEFASIKSKQLYTMITPSLFVSSFSYKPYHLKIMEKGFIHNKKKETIKDVSSSNRVDVFSVASGHLYERLTKIMMLSVKRNTEYNVKFWIVKNFLSPTFKATLPSMAEQYNFSYQLVSYKWPNWLRPQQEKQRIIWGNKILFLDVLFPVDLDRVIYIDADQIVRTDLNELMRMDFKGAPYAFTPMCNSRPETESFRFWKRGYWLDHLQGKPYHISALFAIDLNKFREMNAGDILRYHYQQLSADSGSLANLDQDLPNFAQDQIPIFSLPQEWLWCETWCSDETMSKAKTIDLCNNPLTKRPKLEIAQTRVGEWPGLDEEARSISASSDEYQRQFFPH